MAEIDDQRRILCEELLEWRDAGGHIENLLDAIEAFVDAKLTQRAGIPLKVPMWPPEGKKDDR